MVSRTSFLFRPALESKSEANLFARIFTTFYLGWKLVKKTKIVPIQDIDLWTGRVDLVDQDLSEERGILQKVASKLF